MIEYEYHDTVVLDIVDTIVPLEPIELEGYTKSLTAAPAYLFDHPYAFEVRRNGVVHVPREEYRGFRESVNERFLRDPTLQVALRRRFVDVSIGLDGVFERNIVRAGVGVGGLWDLFAKLMCFVCLNWLIPQDAFKARIGQLLGCSREDAENFAAALCFSDVMPHFLHLELRRIDCALALAVGRHNAIDQYAVECGHLHEMAFWQQEAENPEWLRQWLSTYFDSSTDLFQMRERILAARASAYKRYADAISVIDVFPFRRQRDRAEMYNIGRILNLFATLEEYRHIMQRNVMRAVRSEAQLLGLAPGSVTTAALGIR